MTIEQFEQAESLIEAMRNIQELLEESSLKNNNDLCELKDSRFLYVRQTDTNTKRSILVVATISNPRIKYANGVTVVVRI
jgi:hypothetical protein